MGEDVSTSQSQSQSQPQSTIDDASGPAEPRPQVRAPIPQPQKPHSSNAPSPAPPESDSDDPTILLTPSMKCRRKGCHATFSGDTDRNGEKCVFHPGPPIFHDGGKGYACCRRRVLEFDEFMQIEGCQTKSKHLFVGSGKKMRERQSGEEMVETVR